MAGRTKGAPKTGGRVAGTPNKVTTDTIVQLREANMVIAKELTSDQMDALTPKEVMMRIMRTAYKSGHIPLALAAAEKCAPYIHARLQAVAVTADLRRRPHDFTDQELLALARDVSEDEEEEVPTKITDIN